LYYVYYGISVKGMIPEDDRDSSPLRAEKRRNTAAYPADAHVVRATITGLALRQVPEA
jgi:hypothetical protein